MNLAKVIGTVWATQKDANFDGSKLLLIQPVDEKMKPFGQPLAAVDTVGSGVGETIFYITAREAVIAMKHDVDHMTPVDAAIVGIVDSIEERAF